MLHPPVVHSTARMTPMARSRIRWYSRSVRVIAGATVIESRLHSHRVEVLDRADDHDVWRAVAHHLELYSFHAEDRLLEEHLGGRAGREPEPGDAPRSPPSYAMPDPAPPMVTMAARRPGTRARRLP